ncbi:AAA family ATPase [Dyadobacter psychrotolerans]|uniref:SMC family ATPase n=1 Tax=Dyadobacter psychrotolerans TaxID=2541721 RepID=A0A4R5DHY5_9BACT|nr:SMC family ATPase [Dyadobacter psychrotolerans]TDE11541.1 SMC family ATPase [Dyadobacter psychrotolerans]
MIPKYLKIKGLYSYQTEQEIHFDALTDASLFGIFGSVGSGKSSILEAITFALYGDTERLNKSGDDRTYNMMNLRSDELLIDFECIAGKSGDLYRFTVRGKRNSKNFKEVKTFERKAYIRKDNFWVPLSENETTEHIIGLSYDNFRRTIIIPQGRFQEFIELKDAERTRMMKELFQLEKYDLSRNVGTLNKKNDMELSNVDGQLQGLGEVTPEMIEEEEKKREEVRSKIKVANEQLVNLTAQLDQFQKLKEVFEKVKTLQIQLAELESQRSGIEIREEKLRIFEICLLHFKTFFEQQKSLSNAILRDQLSFDKNKVRDIELTALLASEKEILDSLHQQYEKRHELLDMAEELEKVVQIQDLFSQAEKSKSALVRDEEKLKEKEEVIAKLKKEKAAKEEDNEVKKSLQTDIQALSQIKSWFATSDEIQENRKNVLKEADDLKREITQVQVQLTEKINAANLRFATDFTATSTLGNLSDFTRSYLENNEKLRENISKQTIVIQTQLALNQYAAGLSEGDACPLCGAVHHPAVLHADNSLEQQIIKKDEERNQLLKDDQLIRRFQSAIERDFSQIEHLEKQKITINSKYKEIKERVSEHDLLFVWEKFDRNNRSAFDQHFADVERNQKLIRENELLIKSKAAAIETATQEKAEKIEKSLQNLKNEILKIESTVSTLSEQLILVKITDFAGQDKMAISLKVNELKGSHEKIKQLYEQTETQIDLLYKEKNTISGSQTTLFAALETNQKELDQVQKSIWEQLAVHGFENESKVQEILSDTIQTVSERKLIDAFKTGLSLTKRDLETLKTENQDQVYDPEKHEKLAKEKDSLNQNLNSLRKEEGLLEGLLKKMAENLARKALLLKEKERLQLRKEHLDDLARLFRSSGFVDYASSIYLQNLIQAANHRFHQMTHQQLHLELGEGNSFWVRDLLNGGHIRLLKTLSGGQKFQAALSLALALADHIHVRNESKHNFFFLDEGFGSLDKNALQTVFETLKSLRKENRIVGIISHVEDLQQEIQTYLKIEQTEDGSKILPSWK